MLHRSKLRLLAERRPSSPEWIREPGEFDRELDRYGLIAMCLVRGI